MDINNLQMLQMTATYAEAGRRAQMKIATPLLLLAASALLVLRPLVSIDTYATVTWLGAAITAVCLAIRAVVYLRRVYPETARGESESDEQWESRLRAMC